MLKMMLCLDSYQLTRHIITKTVRIPTMLSDYNISHIATNVFDNIDDDVPATFSEALKKFNLILGFGCRLRNRIYAC